jgi:hypothetical protein
MPWTGPLQSLLDNLSGTTARILGALAFVVGGAIWAFTRHEEGVVIEAAKRFLARVAVDVCHALTPRFDSSFTDPSLLSEIP